MNRNDLAHKSQLPFGDETLLSRHLKNLKDFGIEKTFLILGHNKDIVKSYVEGLGMGMPLEFIDNDLYASTGNTLSLVMGLRETDQDVLILDGDVFYPRRIFQEYAKNSDVNSFAIVPTDIDDEECSKTLLKDDGKIAAFITKRLLTDEEKSRYKFSGEAIGFFKLSRSSALGFVEMYEKNEKDYINTLWEIPFSEFAGNVDISPWKINESGCFEIDTQEDYETALEWSLRHPEA